MELNQASRWRSLLGKAGAVFCLLMLLALLDGIVAKFREPFNVVSVIPGMTVEMNGPLTDKVGDIGDLISVSSTDQIELSFAALQRGYFLGGSMWQGQLRVSDQIPAGEYTLNVGIKGEAPARPLPPFRIVVYPDAYSLRQSYKSLIQRNSGISPWGAAAVFLPFILLVFGLVFLLSQKMERLMAQKGQAEVYRVSKQDGRYVFRFGLGTAHGIRPGAHLVLYNDRGQSLGAVEVQETSATDSLATIASDREVKPGYLVSREHI